MDPETFDPEDTIEEGYPVPNGCALLYIWDDDISVWRRAGASDLSPPFAKRISLLTGKGWLREGVNEAVG